MESTNAADGSRLITVLDEFSLLQSLSNKEYSQLESDFKKLQQAYEAAGRQKKVPKCSPDDRYGVVMGQFFEENKGAMAMMNELVSEVNSLLKKAIQKFGCPKDTKMNDLVNYFATFFRQVTELRLELQKKRALEEELRRKQEANERMQQHLLKGMHSREQGSDLVNDYATMKKKQLQGVEGQSEGSSYVTMAPVQQRFQFATDNSDNFGVEPTLPFGLVQLKSPRKSTSSGCQTPPFLPSPLKLSRKNTRGSPCTSRFSQRILSVNVSDSNVSSE